MSAIEVKVPDIGDFKNVPVIEIPVKPGDVVKLDDPLLVLESDKASMEVPSPAAGKVVEILVKLGDKVSEGSLILKLEAEGAEAPASGAAPASPPIAPPPAPDAPRSDAQPIAVTDTDAGIIRGPTPIVGSANYPPLAGDFSNVYASPAVRRLARELDIDLNRISGTGDKGRVTKEDVKKALTGGAPAGAPAAGGAGIPEIPVIDFSKFGPVEDKPLSRIKKLSGPFLHRSWLNVPAVTQHDEADITELEEFRKKLDDEGKAAKPKPYRVSLLPFLIRASVAVLKQMPDFNSSLNPAKDGLIVKKYWNIGFACDTPEGLVVPVIKDADKKGVLQISTELGELSAKARDGKLSPSEMSGATFTISSLGGIGGTGFSPIVNAPEVAILGVVRSKMAPVWNGKEFVPRLMLPLSLSYDHRVIDGAAAARFARALAVVLEDIRRLAL
jgi:pyruvate dehydrogenase E2 component (dihydrolipoamide acetyltransferase)